MSETPIIVELIPIFNFVLWLGTIAWCAKLGTNDSVLSAIFLSVIYYGFWNHDLWTSPSEMFSFHILMLMVMLLTPQSLFWRIFFSVSILMTIGDGFWMAVPDIRPWLETILPEMGMAFPYSRTWWQMFLEILFWILCFSTLWICYLAHSIDKLERKLKHGYIWAYIGDFLILAKMAGIDKLSAVSLHKKNR